VSSGGTSNPPPGKRFRDAVEAERPLQVVGTINAYSALLAERAGFRAIYLSGAGVANAIFALPDLGVTTLNDVLEDARRITRATTCRCWSTSTPASAARSASREPSAT
jgi:methylisocitrate lyase